MSLHVCINQQEWGPTSIKTRFKSITRAIELFDLATAHVHLCCTRIMMYPMRGELRQRPRCDALDACAGLHGNGANTQDWFFQFWVSSWCISL